MDNKIIAIILVLEFILLYLGGYLQNVILGIAGAFMLVGMAVITIVTKGT